jgi:hypothetical protein
MALRRRGPRLRRLVPHRERIGTFPYRRSGIRTRGCFSTRSNSAQSSPHDRDPCPFKQGRRPVRRRRPSCRRGDARVSGLLEKTQPKPSGCALPVNQGRREDPGRRRRISPARVGRDRGAGQETPRVRSPIIPPNPEKALKVAGTRGTNLPAPGRRLRCSGRKRNPEPPLLS